MCLLETQSQGCAEKSPETSGVARIELKRLRFPSCASRVAALQCAVRSTRFARSSGPIYNKDTELRSRGLIYRVLAFPPEFLFTQADLFSCSFFCSVTFQL